jgi:hypothetical protein
LSAAPTRFLRRSLVLVVLRSVPVLAGVAILLGCEGQPGLPEPTASPLVALRAPPGALQTVARVTLTVTGSGMQTMTRDLSIAGNQATGTLTVPAGENRTFSVVAADAQGATLATGSRTVDLQAGSSPTVSIDLVAAGSIVGSWRFDYDASMYEIWTFDAAGGFEDYLYVDGDVHTAVGTYSTAGNQLTITVDLLSLAYTYSIGGGGNELTITDDEGYSWTFYRVA